MSGAAKAWVNFNGTGTIAIRASFNVSSITDNGVGDYTVNFTSALSNANFSVVATAQRDVSGDVTPAVLHIYPSPTYSDAMSTSFVRLQSRFSTPGTVTDAAICCIAVFR